MWLLRTVLFTCCFLNYLVVSVIFVWSCIFEQCAYAAVSITCQMYSIIFVPYQTAGFGVFAGRAFKKDEVVLRSWRTLFLPKNFPRRQAAWYYLFGHNKTHMALVLDYGSLVNHHESANTRHTGFNNIHFQVRRDFQCANRNVVKICSIYIYNRYT